MVKDGNSDSASGVSKPFFRTWQEYKYYASLYAPIYLFLTLVTSGLTYGLGYSNGQAAGRAKGFEETRKETDNIVRSAVDATTKEYISREVERICTQQLKDKDLLRAGDLSQRDNECSEKIDRAKRAARDESLRAAQSISELRALFDRYKTKVDASAKAQSDQDTITTAEAIVSTSKAGRQMLKQIAEEVFNGTATALEQALREKDPKKLRELLRELRVGMELKEVLLKQRLEELRKIE